LARLDELFSEIDESEAALERAGQGLDTGLARCSRPQSLAVLGGLAELVLLELNSREHRSRSSIRQIKKFAPAIGADVALYDLAGAKLAKQAAGGASQPVFSAGPYTPRRLAISFAAPAPAGSPT
jgi:hypothetical protein